ncbi:MAG: hypothetical protein KA167_09395, partial [Ottowia sp.]|nr:hypothetical protein [Ottowia sp.]
MAAATALCLGWGATNAAMAQQAAAPAVAAAPAPEGSADGRHGTFKAVQGDVTVVRGTLRSAAVVAAGVQATDR